VFTPGEASVRSRVDPLLSTDETGGLLCTGSPSLSPGHGGFAADNEERVASIKQRWLRQGS